MDTQDQFDKDALALKDLVVKRSNELREHADSVIIICTMSEGANSQMVFDYKGNIYAVSGSLERLSEIMEANRTKDNEASEL